MFKLIKDLSFFCLAFSGILILSGCETEEKINSNSSSIVSYNEDFTKNQAQLINKNMSEQKTISKTSQ
ncbi:hypothetical protein [Acinetobacter calcoaceticus]|uniref:hypothetical protein n=1 Tax=Acinetobacter calcoaceticus TaxID=471 RepID=UPI003AF9F4CC